MKYMGSKRRMLKNGLGKLISGNAHHYNRFIDLFSGAAPVSWFTAEHTQLQVVAYDLQEYAVILAKAVLCRNEPLNQEAVSIEWLERVKKRRLRSKRWIKALEVEKIKDVSRRVIESRAMCSQLGQGANICKAYGGFYFSPAQALTFDVMLSLLPDREPLRSVCLAATIFAASMCAASPGHTAQPFRPTERAGKFILESWSKDPLNEAKKALSVICPRHAKVMGYAKIGEACEIAKTLKSTDLVFIDPPYTGVHYSRFYHVLETIARGTCGPVSGAGRYPPFDERPRSSFSVSSESFDALDNLLNSLSSAGASVILTFPSSECSNGLSGDLVIDTSRKYFKFRRKTVNGKFSTLGGNNRIRASRKPSEELLLFMKPK